MLSNVLREVLLWIMHTVKFYAQWHRFHMRRHGLELPLDIKMNADLKVHHASMTATFTVPAAQR